VRSLIAEQDKTDGGNNINPFEIKLLPVGDCVFRATQRVNYQFSSQ